MIQKGQNPLLPYQNKWVALRTSTKKVLAFASSAKALSHKLTNKRTEGIIMTKVLPFDGYYSP